MPTKHRLSWEPRNRRWWKMFRGVRYVVSCRQLAKWCGRHVPESKEASYPIAARWWEAKLAELGIREPPEPIDERSAGRLAEAWLELKAAKVRAGELSPRAMDNLEDCLHHFRDWLGPVVSVEAINTQTVERYYIFLSDRVAAGRWSKDFAAKCFRTFRQFVEWAAGHGYVAKPPNLDSREFRFRRRVKEVPVMAPAEVRRLIDAAPGQLRLHLLLMANCGMTQGDVSDLRHDEVDWRAGRITRKRSKTRDEANAPTVRYPLWGPTIALLKEYRSNDPDVVLTTKSGRRWVWNEWVDGKLRSSDSIATNYSRLRERLKSGPLKLIRKTSASLLDSHEYWGRYAAHFLGHSPRSIADRHYVRPSVEQFDRAVIWLGEQYGYQAAPERRKAG